MPTLVVPDEQTWCAAGAEVSSFGARPVFDAAAARRVLLPDQIPQALRDSLAGLREQLPTDVDVDIRPLRLPEQPLADHGDPEHHVKAHHDHGGRDHGGHHDMMAIVGEPSADGLVMERIHMRYGPLGAPIPGGLAVEATLDGDVVERATVNALLVAAMPLTSGASPPDALTPTAWRSACDAAAGTAESDGWRRVAAIELERAGSHLAWLRSLARLLGWAVLSVRADEASQAVTAARDQLAQGAAPRLTDALRSLGPVSALVLHSRWMAIRTRGHGSLSAGVARDTGLRGPVARASGVDEDARASDAVYSELGFRALTETDGDARARTCLRVREAAQSLEFTGAALDAAASARSAPAPSAWVEGPRGPILAERAEEGWRPHAQGVAQARSAAAAAMAGLEWSTALAVLASFDLSPWQVDP